jgi:ubiquitin-conjugating enzyme E2 I
LSRFLKARYFISLQIMSARERLQEEKKEMQRDRPFGFYARPKRKPDGSTDILFWECGVPGKPGSIWARPSGEGYKIDVKFSEDYPMKPPECKFNPPIFHPNIFPSGTVCLSILNEDKDWVPTITIKQVLFGIQELLDNPNLSDPAQSEAFNMMKNDKAKYVEVVKKLAKAYN